jgi:hypothetical protein
LKSRLRPLKVEAVIGGTLFGLDLFCSDRRADQPRK